MRPCIAAVVVVLALLAASQAWAQVPWEVRTYIDTDWDSGETGAPGGFPGALTNYYPAPSLAQISTENTIKEPYVCPYCGYSTDVPGNCPNPWQLQNHGTVALQRPELPERFFQFAWVNAATPYLALVRGMPCRPGPVSAAVLRTAPTMQQSRVRAAFAFDPNAQSLARGFASDSRFRFLLVPPGTARPTARYYDLKWHDTTGNPVTGEDWGVTSVISQGDLRVGVHPWRAVDGDCYQVRIRAVVNLQDGIPDPNNAGQYLVAADGDWNDYHAADTQDPPRWTARWERKYTAFRVQVWSDANGLEMDRNFIDQTGAPPNNKTTEEQLNARTGTTPDDGPRNLDLVTDSGAVRLTIPLNELNPGTLADGDYTLWWVFGFHICNNARTLPGADDGIAGTGTIDWLTNPDTPDTWDDLKDPTKYESPQRYFAPTSGVVDDTALTDAQADEFRLRPGEVGTGLVATIWRAARPAGWTPNADQSKTNMWSYDENAAVEGLASDFDDPAGTYPNHGAATKPAAGRFFSTRIEVPRPAVGALTSLADLTTRVSLLGGMPGGQTETGAVDVESREPQGSPGGAAYRENVTVVRCPGFVATPQGRSADAGPPPYTYPPAAYRDTYWPGEKGHMTGRAPSGDPAVDYTGPGTVPNRTIGCGAVHRIWYRLNGGTLVPVKCWCGREFKDPTTGTWMAGHNPDVPESMRCNYCGTILRVQAHYQWTYTGGPASVDSTLPVDTVPGAVEADVAPALDSSGHHRLSGMDMAGGAARRPQDSAPAREEIPNAWVDEDSPPSPLPPANANALAVTSLPLFIDIPQFQQASYPWVGQVFHNDMTTPLPYQGGFVAYRAVDEKNPWYEVQGASGVVHYPHPTAEPDAARRLYDRNGQWDAYYTCPDCGNKLSAAGPCNYAGCPGHQICARCGVSYESAGEGLDSEKKYVMLDGCPFCPQDSTHKLRPLTPVAPPVASASDNLTAEEFDPVVLASNVLRKTRLGTDQLTVDLGRTAPGVAGGANFPNSTSPPVTGPAATETNYVLAPANFLAQGASAGPAAGGSYLTVTTTSPEQLALVRDDVSTAAEFRSPLRIAASMPLTAARLLAALPNNTATGWGGNFDRPPQAGSAGAQAAMALLQAGGTAAGTVPNALGSGSYSGTVLVFVDLPDANGNFNGALDFLDRSQGLTATTSAAMVFDPTEDIPLEPVAALNTRMRVVESPLPWNSTDASDASAMPLFLDTAGNHSHDALEVLWETNRRWPPQTGTPDPDAPVNLAENTATASGPGIAWDYTWSGNATAQVTKDTAARAVNGSPETYIDAAATPGRKWALWHQVAPAQTETGFTSALWASSGAQNVSTAFGQAANTNIVFDAALEQNFIRGLVRPDTANPSSKSIHWAFWNAGRRGQEGIHYSPGYDPTDPKTMRNLVLPVSNAVAAAAKRDLVSVNGRWLRKPSKSPFTYARDPAPVLAADPASGNDQVHVFFSGFVTQDGNPDICYVRYNADDMGNPERNYGKVPQPIVGGTLSNTNGEQFRSDGLHQTFGSRHLDWLTTACPPGSTPNAANNPDFIAARSSAVDPRLWLYTVTSGNAPWGSGLELTWTGGRYDRATGVYRLSGLRLGGVAMPVDPRSQRPLELEIDPAAGVVRFSAPLFDAAQPNNPAAVYNTGQAAYNNLVDVQLWASYIPYVFRVCRDDANDDSPSAFFDYSGPALQPTGLSPTQRAALGRTVVFWRRSHGSTEAPHFGRTTFLYKTFTNAIQVGLQLSGAPTVTDITAGGAVTPLATDADNGIIGLPAVQSGHLVRVVYAGHTEYHTVPGWTDEQRVNVDSVFSEGPLVVQREWHATAVGNATLYLPRYWLFWTSPRVWYQADADPANCRFNQSRDVYYATVVPESETAIPEQHRP